MKELISKMFLFTCGILSFAVSNSQKDTTKPKAIDITSSFKPVLKEAAKINFNATPPSADTAKPRLQYEIPNPNFFCLSARFIKATGIAN